MKAIAILVAAGAAAGAAAGLWVLLALADANPTVHPDAALALARWLALGYAGAGAVLFAVAGAVLRALAGAPTTARAARAAGLVAALGAAAAAAVAAPRVLALANPPEVATAAPPPAPAAAGARVLLLGIDGADWDQIDALVAAGDLPTLGGLVARGARAPLRTFEPTWSPLIWNTIATGVAPERHGILDFEQLRVAGARCGPQRLLKHPVMTPHHVGFSAFVRLAKATGIALQVPVSGCHRKAKAVWNELDDAGLRVGVVNWFASYPAEELDGYVISDNNPKRAAFFRGKHGASNMAPGPITHPADLLERIDAGSFVTPAAPSPLDVLDHPVFAEVPPDARELLARDPGTLHEAGQLIDADVFAARAAAALLRAEPLDFLAVYMSGVDNIGHRFGRQRGVVHNFYRLADSLVGEILAAAGPDVTVVLVSDHGWSYEEADYGHNHAPDGVFLVSGPGARAGARLADAPSVYDVAPTVLALFGLPPSSAFEGAAVAGALEPARLAAAPATPIDYGGYRAPEVGLLPDEPSQLESETIDKLRALGYVE